MRRGRQPASPTPFVLALHRNAQGRQMLAHLGRGTRFDELTADAVRGLEQVREYLRLLGK